MTESLPDLITLLQLAVGAGCNIPAAIEVICPTGPPRLRPDLDAARRRLRAGDRAIDTVARLRDRWGPPSHPLTDALVDHLHDGTPLLPALDRAADAARHHRRRLAEIRARRLPVLLLFPLVLCTLPAFGLLTVAPMVASTLDALDVRPLEAEASP